MKEIEGFPDYFVTDTGEIYSKKTGKLVKRKIQTAYHGYKMVEIRTVESKAYFKSVHRLVALAFVDNPEGKPQVNHIDGDKSNNNASNLEWCTEAENTAHAIETGLRNHGRGESNNWSTTTESQIRHACELLQAGDLSRKEIADITGVCGDTLYKLRVGRSWKHVACDYDLKPPSKISKRLPESKIAEICAGLNSGKTGTQIAKETGVTKYVVSGIKRGYNYSCISKKYLHEAPTAIESTSSDGSE